MVLIQAQANEETAAHMRSMVEYKASLLDRTDSAEVKKFNDLVEKAHIATFPESPATKTAGEDFQAKAKKLLAMPKTFGTPDKIQNYKKKA